MGWTRRECTEPGVLGEGDVVELACVVSKVSCEWPECLVSATAEVCVVGELGRAELGRAELRLLHSRQPLVVSSRHGPQYFGQYRQQCRVVVGT